jgi:hypothetical protein
VEHDDLITSPGTELWETCTALNRGIDANAYDALRQILSLGKAPPSKLYLVLGQLAERFDVVEICVKHVFREHKQLCDQNIAYLHEMRHFLTYDRLKQPWQQLRASCFDSNKMHNLQFIGHQLTSRFPLKKLSDSERVKRLRELQELMKEMKSEQVYASVERALLASLEMLAFMLEHYSFFGTIAVRSQVEDIHFQAAYFAKSGGRGGKKNAARRKANCKAIYVLTCGLLLNLAVEGPIKANEWLVAMDELPPRVEALVHIAVAEVKQLGAPTIKLITGPSSNSADGQADSSSTDHHE